MTNSQHVQPRFQGGVVCDGHTFFACLFLSF